MSSSIGSTRTRRFSSSTTSVAFRTRPIRIYGASHFCVESMACLRQKGHFGPWREVAILPAPMANDTVEKPVAAEDGVWTTNEDGDLVPDYDATFPTINEGEVVHGTVVRVDKDEVLVDIGYKSEGVIPTSELSIRRSVNPSDEVAVGEEIDALVLTKEDA